MRLRLLGTIVAAAVGSAAPAHADVRVSIADGRVSVSATDATPRQILLEWARAGQTRVVNAERLTGPPMSIELTNVPEAQALDTLLRSASGYVAAPRATDLPNASQFDRIFILATSSAARPAATPPPPSPAPAAFQPPAFAPPGDQPPDDQPARQLPSPGQPSGGPARPAAFSTFPQPQPIQPRVPMPIQAAPTPAPAADPGQPGTVTAPVGVARPGMPTPVPQQPGQPQPGVNQR